MNVGEMLDELRGNILRDKSTIVSGASDRLWSDESLMRYMNEAYNLFARRSMTNDFTSCERISPILGQCHAASSFPIGFSD